MRGVGLFEIFAFSNKRRSIEPSIFSLGFGDRILLPELIAPDIRDGEAGLRYAATMKGV